MRTIGFIAAVFTVIALWPQEAGAGGRIASNIVATAATQLVQTTPAKSSVNKRLPKAQPKSYANHTIIGASELVLILPQKIQIRAKIDTGAKSSSIDARVLERFIRDGTDWVRFQVFGEEDATHKMELPIARSVRIRRAGTPRDVRPAVIMRICLATVAADVLVNFAERRELNHRMLLGRDFLKDRFLIDADPSYLTRPSCTEKARK